MTGLDLILETLEARYEYDARGRIVADRIGGVLPRFVLGRSTEGCIWRFGSGLEAHLVISIAKLAGREPGRSITAEVSAPPERLGMIQRLLGVEPKTGLSNREVLTRVGVAHSELWTIE